MGLLEDALRDTFAAQVAAPPAAEATADRAIAGAGRIRRRHRLVTTAAVVMVGVLAVGVGLASARSNVHGPADVTVGPGGATPSSAVRLPILPLDLLNNRAIYRAAGGAVSLAALPDPRRVWRVRTGWLVQTFDPSVSRAGLWSVTDTGTANELVQAEAVTVGAGSIGPTVAWSSAGTVGMATFVDGTLVSAATTGGTGDLQAVAVVGGGVLLSPGDDTYDMWFPAKGDFRTAPKARTPILAVTGDGTNLYGLSEDHKCLVRVDPTGLTVKSSTCVLAVDRHDTVLASPDGHWLAISSGKVIRLFDVGTLWTKPIESANWPLAATSLAWLDGSTLIATESLPVTSMTEYDLAPGATPPVDWSGQPTPAVVRLRVDAPGKEEIFPVPDLSGAISVVTDLRN